MLRSRWRTSSRPDADDLTQINLEEYLMNIRAAIASLLLSSLTVPIASDACSRAVYFGQEGQTVTGRTMDWFVSDMDTNLWLYPRGLERSSNTSSPVNWKSRYGTVVTTIYEGAAADGMNERGLVANMLYLAESKYPAAATGDNRPTLPISAWAQYVLDNYATTAEAVEGMRKEDFRMVAIKAPTGEEGTVHLSISDASGDSAIFEYIDGKLVIHHGRQYQVMTNSPTYDQQLSLAKYWENIGGATMLPGTNRASDRFARMSYYINEATQTGDPRRSVATVFSVMRNVSVPLGIKVPGQPNIADTLWLTVSDQKNKVYYYQDTNSPSILWVRLNDLNFKEGSGARKLQLDGNPDVAGDQTKNFKPALLFEFLAPHD
jgi:penicillin V acylase-like amidase (Ntn superfamily)